MESSPSDLTRDEERDTIPGSSSAWLGWQNVEAALTDFSEAIEHAGTSLQELNLAESVRKWLNDALKQAETYQSRLVNCEDDLLVAVQVIKELEEEAEEIEDLLEFLEEIPDLIDEEIGDEASDRVKHDIANFISSKLEAVKKAGWHLYHVFIHAA